MLVKYRSFFFRKERPRHFEELVKEGYEKMYKGPESLSSPGIIAKVIYKAATDNASQLR
jgi:hypothetical protein